MRKPTGTTIYGDSVASLVPPPPASADDSAPYDTLAQLFLGEIGGEGCTRASSPATGAGSAAAATLGRIGAGTASPAAAREPLECLVLGHLPVLGSAWVAQYARCIAEDEDVTVGLVQVRAGYATVEVVACDDEAMEQPPQARATLEAAISAAAAVAGRWVLRVEEPDEAMAASHPRTTAVTLLTSADEMAVVAAYRTLKRLLGDEGGDTEDGSGHRPEVRVSIMGAPEPAAAAVFAKLAEAARMFMHRPIERAPGVHRVSAAGTSLVLFSGPVDHGAARAIEAIGASRPRLQRRGGAAETRRWIRLAPETSLDESMPETPPPAESAVTATGSSSETMRRTNHTSATLASHIAGLTPLAITCPYAPEVQLGIDGEGRLHVLARHDVAQGSGLEPLTIAASWASAHSALLNAAAMHLGAGRGMAPATSAAPPAMHLFVDEPREIRRLLEADLRVHLLAAVEVAGQTAWVCRDLN